MLINYHKIFSVIHFAAPILIGLFAITQIQNQFLFPYSLLTILSALSLGLSSGSLSNKNGSKFLYLFSLLISLGCWFKYTVYTIFPEVGFRESIGDFELGSPAESKVLWVAIVGILGIISTSFFHEKYLKRKLKISNLPLKGSIAPLLPAIILLSLTALFSFINLKFNILLFALKPEVQLPFKGNVIFFLFLTRALPFLFIFFCLKRFNIFYISIGALLFSVSSIGVLSRMGILIYFFVVSFLVLDEIKTWDSFQFMKNVLFLGAIFSIATYLNVSLSTGARDYFFETARLEKQRNNNIDLSIDNVLESTAKADNFKTLKELALGRWIGMEGIMAVEAYPHKGINLFTSALQEGSYSGNSFYSKITYPNMINDIDSKTVSTSLPGPIAFFYYTGSLTFVFMALFFITILYVLLEHLFATLLPSLIASTSFIVVTLTLDLYQLGISPIAFLKYQGFTIVCLLTFIFFYRKFINTSAQR